MKRNSIIVFFVINICIMLYSTLGVSAATSGTCGADIEWKLYDNGILAITGSGNMYDYNNYKSRYSWDKELVSEVQIDGGITRIETRAFSEHNSLTKFIVYNTSQNYCTIDGNIYNKNATTLILYAPGKTDVSFSVPSSVSKIASYAFANNTNIKNIVLSSALTEIENDAFSGCENISNIEIPNNVKTIGEDAFANCTNLESVYLPKSLTTISDDCFYGCSNILSISVDENNPSYCAIDGNLYNREKTSLIQYAVGKSDSEFEIPHGVTRLGYNSFKNAINITKISLPSTLKSVGDGVMLSAPFEGCVNIKEIHISDLEAYCNFDIGYISPFKYGAKLYLNGIIVTELIIPETITSINNCSFSYCSSITSVTIHCNVTDIEFGSFSNCTGLTDFIVDGNNSKFISVDGVLYNKEMTELLQYPTGCTKATFEIPDNITSIEFRAFQGAANLEEITCSNSLSVIKNLAFSDCVKLRQINFMGTEEEWNQITSSIEFYMPYLENATKLFFELENNCISVVNCNVEAEGTVCIPEKISNYSVTKISNNAFENCSEINSVNMPNTISLIGENAFKNCTNLQNVIISNNVSFIGAYAFYDCTSLKDITIPEKVADIKAYTFYNCTNMSILNMHDNISSIEKYAFYNCKSLSEIIMPANLITIGNNAFRKCKQIEKLDLSLKLNSIGSYAFYECSLYPNIVVPKSVMSIGTDAFGSDDTMFALYCYDGSYGVEYAIDEGINYIVIDDVRDSGSLNNSIDWCLYNNGVLRVTGVGEIPENAGNAWASYVEDIKLISIENGIENIPNGLVNNCTNIERIRIAASINYIDIGSFVNLLNLKTIQVSSNSNVYSSTDKELFNKDKTTLMLTLSKGVSYYVSDSVDTIGENSFLLNNSLERIIIPGTVTTINEGAFDNCKNLKLYIQAESAVEAYAVERNIPFQSLLDTGSFGTNAKYYIYDDGLMLVNGTGTTVNNPTWKTEYNKNVINVIVEEGITGLGTSAFAACSNMESVSLPDSLINIGAYAFNGCTKLKSICIPNGVTTLSNSVFYNCDGLTEMIIPDSVTAIGDSAFYSCGGLTEITIPDSVTTIGNYAFKYSAIKDIVIGDGVTDIGEQAFYDSRLESITLGKNIKTIGKNAFTYCYITKVNLTSVEAWLNISFGNSSSNPLGDTMYSSADLYINNELAKHITIPDGVTTIGDDAFYYCDEIRSITIPASVTYIGKSAFYDCEKLLDVYFKGTREQWNSIEKTNSYIEVACIHCADEAELPYSPESDFVFSNGVISGYTGSDNIINVPATIGGIPVKMIADKAFYSVSATQIYLPEGILQLGKAAFQNSSVRRINIPSTVKSIGSYAFYITDIVEIEIPVGIKTIPTYTFAYCSNLEKLTIPSSIETMESDAFCSTHVEELHISDLGAWCNISFADSNSTPMYSNTLLYVNDEIAIDVTIPDNATQISKYAFYKYDELKSVVVPSSVKSIGDYAFYECSSLENIIIPDSVTKIGYQTFYECSSLENVIIPDSVTNIGYQSFYNCSTLDYVKIGSGVKSIDNSAFAGCSKLTEVDMGDNVTYIGSGVFKDCVSLQSIIIPQVTSIPSNAFYNCYALKQIEIPKTVTSIGNSAFYACYGITDIYYKGDKDAWAAINLGSDNEPLTYGTVHFGELAETKLSLDYAIGMNYKAVRFSVKNAPIGAKVILACYNDLGALSHMESIECTEETVSSEFNITNIPNISSAKIMVWGNWSNLKPLCKAEPIDIGWFDLNE